MKFLFKISPLFKYLFNSESILITSSWYKHSTSWSTPNSMSMSFSTHRIWSSLIFDNNSHFPHLLVKKG